LIRPFHKNLLIRAEGNAARNAAQSATPSRLWRSARDFRGLYGRLPGPSNRADGHEA
jgi:hypothetical protein